MTRAQSQYLLGTLLTVGLVFGIVVMANELAGRHFQRLDLTEDRIHTITDSTRAMLAELDDIVNVEVYFSKELPEELRVTRQEVRDLLDEFVVYADGDLIVQWNTPGDDEETARELAMLGIPQVQATVFGTDRLEATNVYMGIAVLFEDRKEVIPVLESARNLEYDLMRSVLQVVRRERPVVGWHSSGTGAPGEITFDDVRTLLRQLYDVRDVSLSGDEPIEGIDVLLVAHPIDLPDEAARAIDAYVMGGGGLVVLADRVEIVQTTGQAQPITTGLEEVLGAWGVTLNEDMVVEPSPEYHIPIQLPSRGPLPLVVYYPLFINVRHFDVDNPVVNRLDQVVMPWAGSMTVSEGPPEGLEVRTLATTSEGSQVQTGYYELTPEVQYAPDPDREAIRPLAVALSGRIPSAYADDPAPLGDDEAVEEPAERAPVPTVSEPGAQVVVVSNSRFVADGLARSNAAMVFLQNTIDWMATGEHLIAVRSRVLQGRPLDDISERAAGNVRLVNTLGVPLLIAAVGIGRALYRRSRRSDLQSLLG